MLLICVNQSEKGQDSADLNDRLGEFSHYAERTAQRANRLLQEHRECCLDRSAATDGGLQILYLQISSPANNAVDIIAG